MQTSLQRLNFGGLFKHLIASHILCVWIEDNSDSWTRLGT